MQTNNNVSPTLKQEVAVTETLFIHFLLLKCDNIMYLCKLTIQCDVINLLDMRRNGSNVRCQVYLLN